MIVIDIFGKRFPFLGGGDDIRVLLRAVALLRREVDGDADIAGEQLRVVQIKYDALLEQFREYTLGELQKQYAVTSRDGISATKQIMA